MFRTHIHYTWTSKTITVIYWELHVEAALCFFDPEKDYISAPGKCISISRQRNGTRPKKNCVNILQVLVYMNFRSVPCLWDKLVVVVWRHGFQLNSLTNFVVNFVEIHAWESGGASILFVGITSYLNQWSSKDNFFPNALGLSASKLLISAHDFSSYYQSTFHVMWYQASKQ